MSTATARQFTVRDRTFGCIVRFSITPQLEVSRRACVRWLRIDPDIGEDGEWCFGYTCSHGNAAFVHLERYPEGENAGALVHELVHAVNGFMRHLGTVDEETQAYLMQFFYREATQRLNGNGWEAMTKLCRKWRKCAEKLHAALCYFAPNLMEEEDGFTAEKDAVKEFRRLSEAKK
jgi:hypothetical protein